MPELEQKKPRNPGKCPVQIFLNPEEDKLVALAAAISGQKKNQFVLQSALAMAKAVRAKDLNGI